MKITKNQLRQLITETLNEAWPDDAHPESMWASGPVYQLNDVLVTALQRTLFEQFLEAGLIGKGPGQMTENDLALDFEELLMDALLPIAEQASLMLGHDPVSSQPEEDFDDDPGMMLSTPTEDPMGRGAQTSSLRRKVMGPVETLEEG